MIKITKILGMIVLIGLVLFALIQLVPYGKDHTNPTKVQEPSWDSPTTRNLAQRACFDCHSNETTWPWYSNIAPVSWLVYRDVVEGRQYLNFTEWSTQLNNSRMGDELSEKINSGEMPPFFYLWMHSTARLNDAEKQQLIQGLQNTIK
jgi:hypothetical protein